MCMYRNTYIHIYIHIPPKGNIYRKRHENTKEVFLKKKRRKHEIFRHGIPKTNKSIRKPTESRRSWRWKLQCQPVSDPCWFNTRCPSTTCTTWRNVSIKHLWSATSSFFKQFEGCKPFNYNIYIYIPFRSQSRAHISRFSLAEGLLKTQYVGTLPYRTGLDLGNPRFFLGHTWILRDIWIYIFTMEL